MTATRGTSSKDVNGNSEDRRRRRKWLLETYAANRDLPNEDWNRPPRNEREAEQFLYIAEVPLGQGVPACRCYRCGDLLSIVTLTVDRIIPGCKGGTYRRSNIRPACGDCNSVTGGAMASGKAHQPAKKAARRASLQKARS